MNGLSRPRSPKPNNHGFAGNSARFWGFKDGRIALTIPIVAKYLPNPHYIYLSRNMENNVKGLYTKNNQGEKKLTMKQCEVVVKEYNRRIIKF